MEFQQDWTFSSTLWSFRWKFERKFPLYHHELKKMSKELGPYQTDSLTAGEEPMLPGDTFRKFGDFFNRILTAHSNIPQNERA